MTTPITCTIRTYNEGGRIKNALTHALKWADEVIVLDKESTDDTQRIAELMGARVITIPFSQQGHEDYVQNYQYGTHDWTWDFTPGEVPMKSVIEAARSVISETVDVVAIRHKYFSFGIHSEHSPWSWSYQPRLFSKSRAKIRNVVHQHIETTKHSILCPGHGYVLHQTHATVESFLRSHTEYMTAELASGTPDEIIARAMRSADSFASQLNAHPELFGHKMAWRLYWQGVALHAWEKKQGVNVPAEYQQRADDFLKQEWGT